MSPNGRRAWRAAAKKLRRKHGLRSASISCFAASNEDEKQENITGAWFKRHGFTMDDPRYKIRQYIGTWGTVDGDGVEFAIKPVPFTPRSLVGMTQGARKRAARQDAMGVRTAVHDFRTSIRIGETLRPCPGCARCGLDVCLEGPNCRWCREYGCDGSGVLPARRACKRLVQSVRVLGDVSFSRLFG